MLAITWAYRCATQTMGMKAIPRKSHGRREKSWFRIGLDALGDWIINSPKAAANAWLVVYRGILFHATCFKGCSRLALFFEGSLGLGV